MDQLQPTGELFVANPAGPGLWSFTEVELESSPGDIGHFLKGSIRTSMAKSMWQLPKIWDLVVIQEEIPQSW